MYIEDDDENDTGETHSSVTCETSEDKESTTIKLGDSKTAEIKSIKSCYLPVSKPKTKKQKAAEQKRRGKAERKNKERKYLSSVEDIVNKNFEVIDSAGQDKGCTAAVFSEGNRRESDMLSVPAGSIDHDSLRTTDKMQKESANPSHQQTKSDQNIGTWASPPGGVLNCARSTNNLIIVDTKDKEAWPSIGDINQSEPTVSDLGDDDSNSSVKSVILSSSHSGRGTSAVVHSGHSASNIRGAKHTMDTNSPWGSTAPIASANSSGWTTNPTTSAVLTNSVTIDNNHYNNQGLNMQSYQGNVTSGSDMNPLTSSLVQGWGSLTNGGGNDLDSTGAHQDSDKNHAGAGGGNSALWQGLNLGTGVVKKGAASPQVNQNTSWNISDKSESENAPDNNSNGVDQWGASSAWGDPGAVKQSSASSGSSWGNPSPGPTSTMTGSSAWGQPVASSTAASSATHNNSNNNVSSQPPAAASGGWGHMPSQSGQSVSSTTTTWGSSTTPSTNPANRPTSWAQAAGKGLNLSSNSGNQNTAAPPAPNPHEEEINRVINQNGGWGAKPIRQDGSWDCEVSPTTKRRELEAKNSNVWNQPVNNGTAIWESSKQQAQAQKQSQQSQGSSGGGGGNWNTDSRGSVQGGFGGAGNAGDSNTDSNTWNGPPVNNTWNGPSQEKNSNNWGSTPGNVYQNSASQNSNAASWGAPQRGSTSGWDGGVSNRGSGSWGDNGRNSGSWGDQQPPPPQQQQIQPKPNPGNQWDGSSAWGEQRGGPAPGNWDTGRAAASQVNSSWSGDRPDNNQWDPNQKGTAVWGEPTGAPVRPGGWNENPPPPPQNKPQGWGEQPPHRPQPQRQWSETSSTGSWGNNGNNGATQRGGGGGWGDSPSVKPMGWGGPDVDKVVVKPSGWGDDPSVGKANTPVDDGTAFWGNPTSSSVKPPQGWNSSGGSAPNTPLTPTPRKPDDCWDSKQPSMKCDSGGWADSVNRDDNMWGGPPSSQQQTGGWGGQWNPSGAKPKTPSTSGGWGTPIDDWNKPESSPGAWNDEITMWGEDDAFTQDNTVSWSSARDFHKRPSSTPYAYNKGADGNMKPQISSNVFHGAIGGGMKSQPPQMRSKLLQQLMDMGFKKEDAQNALIVHDMNLENAIADLITGASAEKELELDPSRRMLRSRMHDNKPNDLPNANDAGGQFIPPISMQNTQPYSSAQQGQMNPQAIANALKIGASHASSLGGGGGGGSLINSSSISSSLQQKIIQHPVLGQQQQQQQQQPAAISQGQPIRGQLPNNPVQQQLVHQQQQLLQQLRMAVQAGLINPQILNQPFTPQMLGALQQMLTHQNLLQRLYAQQQMMQQQSKTNNLIQRSPQLENINFMIGKIKQQIYQTQQQLAQAQAFASKQQNSSKDETVVGRGDSMMPEFATMTLKDPPAQQQPPQQMQSRLNQWKLPSPEKDVGDSAISTTVTSGNDLTLNKAVGSKPLTHSHSSSNLQGQDRVQFGRSLSLGGPGPWSSLSTSSAASDWPSSTSATATSATDTSAITTASSYGNEMPPSSNAANNATGSSASPSSDTKDDKESPSGLVVSSSSANNNQTFNMNDMIPEFVPGKPWQGMATRNIEDDPHITPGSISSRPLSVNTIREDSLTSKMTSNGAEATSTWSNFPKSSTSALQQSKSWIPPTSLTEELWGVPTQKMTTARPPPGLTNQNQKSQLWGNNVPPYGRSISLGGDKSAFSAVGQSSWDQSTNMLVLKNLTPQIDGPTLKTLCMQHGPLLTFHLNLGYGQAIVRYATKEEGLKAQQALNGCTLGNTTIMAEFASDMDIGRISGGGGSGEQHSQHINPTSAATSLWSQTQTRQVNKIDSNQWNGMTGSGFQAGSMWGTGSNNLLGGFGGQGLLPGDLLGGESM
ncbi:uncharacterized protein LOC141904621 isoform X2 [Tubulanus polymorphus]|uniref:uncharacterized protein LOC141904621 isoform X2 n=1 Tax=Tubulanus polymorphus TaxID=672921 RepID=UPI003DA5B919